MESDNVRVGPVEVEIDQHFLCHVIKLVDINKTKYVEHTCITPPVCSSFNIVSYVSQSIKPTLARAMSGSRGWSPFILVSSPTLVS